MRVIRIERMRPKSMSPVPAILAEAPSKSTVVASPAILGPTTEMITVTTLAMTANAMARRCSPA